MMRTSRNKLNGVQFVNVKPTAKVFSGKNDEKEWMVNCCYGCGKCMVMNFPIGILSLYFILKFNFEYFFYTVVSCFILTIITIYRKFGDFEFLTFCLFWLNDF